MAVILAWRGSLLDGNVFGGVWRGTLCWECSYLLVAIVVWLKVRPPLRIRLLIQALLITVFLFMGGQHHARVERRNATADGILPAASTGTPTTAAGIRKLFSPCLSRGGEGANEFYEMEVGVVPPSGNNPAPRWLLTQPYPPIEGVSRVSASRVLI